MTKNISRILCSIGMRGNCDNVLEQGVHLALATGGRACMFYMWSSRLQTM